jgi:hypothetical protein
MDAYLDSFRDTPAHALAGTSHCLCSGQVQFKEEVLAKKWVSRFMVAYSEQPPARVDEGEPTQVLLLYRKPTSSQPDEVKPLRYCQLEDADPHYVGMPKKAKKGRVAVVSPPSRPVDTSLCAGYHRTAAPHHARLTDRPALLPRFASRAYLAAVSLQGFVVTLSSTVGTIFADEFAFYVDEATAAQRWRHVFEAALGAPAMLMQGTLTKTSAPVATVAGVRRKQTEEQRCVVLRHLEQCRLVQGGGTGDQP